MLRTIVVLRDNSHQSGPGDEKARGEGNIMNPNQVLWEKGDFTKIAGFMRGSGDALVNSIGITPSIEALDLGCGDGTTALPLARKGAHVVGIDIARNLVAAGRQRAAQEGLTQLEFREGDASKLEGI